MNLSAKAKSAGAGTCLRLYKKDGLFVMLAYPSCNVLKEWAELQRVIPKWLIQHIIPNNARIVCKLLCMGMKIFRLSQSPPMHALQALCGADAMSC